MRALMRCAQMKQLHELVDEAMLTIESNLEDERFDPSAPREVILKIRIEPEKRDPTQAKVVYSAKIKLPERKGKMDWVVVKDHSLFLEHYAEDVPLFPREVKSDGHFTVTIGSEDDIRDLTEDEVEAIKKALRESKSEDEEKDHAETVL